MYIIMKLIEEIGIRFLIGIFIAILIGFLFWWFVVHNESDRIVERNFLKFYNALDEACLKQSTEDNPTFVYVELPQEGANLLEKLKNEAEEFFGSIFGREKIEIPFQAFEDPYYNFHWERFPPESPYKIGTNIPETLAAIFIPWSEDLPWSSNLFLTLSFEFLFFGIDVFETEELIKPTLRKFKNSLAQRASSVFKRIRNNEGILTRIFDFMEGKIDEINHIKENFELFLKKRGDEIEYIIKIGKEIKEEGRFIFKSTAFYTIICLNIFDKTLGECLVEGSILSTGVGIPAKYVSQKIASLARKKIQTLIWDLEDNIKRFFSKKKEYLDEYFNFLRGNIYYFKGFLKDEREALKNIEDFEYYIKLAKEKLEEISGKENIDEIKSILRDSTNHLKKAKKAIGDLLEKIQEEDNRKKLSVIIRDLDEEINNLDEIIKKESVINLRREIKEIAQLEESFNKIIEENRKFSRKALMDLGFEIKTIDTPDGRKDFLVLEKGKMFEEIKLTVSICRKNINICRYHSRYKDFAFEFDQNGKLIRVVYDPIESVKDEIIKLFKTPILYLKKLSGKMINKKFISNDAAYEALELFKEELVGNAGLKLKLLVEVLRESGYEVTAETVLSRIEKTIERLKNEDIIGILVAKDSPLDELLENIGEESVENLGSLIRQHLSKKLLEERDPLEIKRFWDFINGKSFRVREDLGIFFRVNPIGYATLRAIDLYTPIGASYWDRLISYYGYEGKKVPAGCQTSCEEKKICLQLGACIRQFDLPESCQRINIDNIKLARNSIVASNPRFYLVSPCFSNLKIYIRDDENERNIYIQPILKSEKKINYCYATSGFVNLYISTYIATYLSQIACTFVGGPVGTLACGFLLELFFEILKEATLVWPSAYYFHSYLAQWE